MRPGWLCHIWPLFAGAVRALCQFVIMLSHKTSRWALARLKFRATGDPTVHARSHWLSLAGRRRPGPGGSRHRAPLRIAATASSCLYEAFLTGRTRPHRLICLPCCKQPQGCKYLLGFLFSARRRSNDRGERGGERDGGLTLRVQ
jgi:hypothetical protein